MYTLTRTYRPHSLFAGFDALQRAFEPARRDASGIRSVGRAGFPAINVGTTPEAIDVFVFAPGVDANAIEVTVDKGLLTLSVQRSAEAAKEGEKVTLRERGAGTFRRVVSLPDDADAEQVNATYRDGVLHVRVARREAPKPRRIDVQATH